MSNEGGGSAEGSGESGVRLDSPIEPCAEVVTHWIEIELLDISDVPVAYEAYKVALPSGADATGVLDATGWVRLGPFTGEGNAQISFPKLDARVWSAIDSLDARGGAAGVDGRRRKSRNAGIDITVARGECCTSIADGAGHLWSTIWNDGANAGLRGDCGDPNCLIAGRQLTIPALRPKQEPGAVDRRHRFRFESDAKLVIRITWPDGSLRQNIDYALQIDGGPAPRQTSASGVITLAHLPPQSSLGRLELFDGGGAAFESFTFRLGGLLPDSQRQGVQQRLRNLGRRELVADGVDSEPTKAAVRDAQRAAGEVVTGVAADIAARLKTDHGS